MASTAFLVDRDGTGRRIRASREARSLSVAQLAGLCDCTPQTIRMYEDGSSVPGGDILARLSLALEMSADEILGLRGVR